LTRPNGVNTSYTFDTLSRLLGVLHNGGSLPGSAGYTYDAAGNRLTKTAIQEANPNPVSVTSNYSYDSIYELTQAVVGGTLAESYSYDQVGNRLTSVNPVSYSYNASNELTSTSAPATYAYDNNGNTTSKTDSTGTTSYAWDFENRLASVTLPGTGGTVYFAYDPFGRRIRKVFGSATTIYTYDGANITEELGGGGNLLAYYTQGAGIDEPLSTTEMGGTYFYHPDGSGSITSVTDGSGQLAASFVYDSFGKLTSSSGTMTNPFQYTAREFDSETGLYYYRARYYDPTTGRFLSEDPKRFDAGPNFYPYALENPINWADPLGLDVTITWYAGLHGNQAGHITINVNNNIPTGFDTADPSWDKWVFTGEDVPGAVHDVNDPNRSIWDRVTLKTSPEQDKIIQDYINSRRINPGSYNLASRNCAQFARNSLLQAGIDLGSPTVSTVKPKTLMDELHKYLKLHPK
jgi:RHS repeat-associated protein